MERNSNIYSRRVIISASFLLMVLFSAVLTGCHSRSLNPDQYGVRYIIKGDSELDDQWLTMKLDPADNDVIRSLICVSVDRDLSIDEETISRLSAGSLDDDKNKSPLIVDTHFNEEGKLIQYILINFDLIDIYQIRDLIDYLGLEDELTDSSLSYTELRKSNSFRFRKFFTEGIFENNISLNGDPKYDVNIMD